MTAEHNLRIFFIFFIILFLYLFLTFNLYEIQIQNRSFFKKLAKEQYSINITIPSNRAEIFDRNNIALAINKEIISAFIIPTELKNPDSAKDFLSKYFPRALERLNENSSKFMYIKRKLTESEIELINKENLIDIKLLKEPNRYYPNQSTGPIVGITNIDNQGIIGLEYLYNSVLKGKSSSYDLQKDARSGYFYFENKTKKKESENKNIKTTLDSTLQFLIYEELKEAIKKYKANKGAILVLNPENGDILAMVNYPDFNPNQIENIDLEKTRNRIVSDAYELGSVIKIFLALAALEENVVKSDELIDCENTKKITLNGVSFSTLKAHGKLSFSEVIERSNNIGIAKVALRLDKKIYDHYKMLGFGQKIGILPGENPGFVNPAKKWSKASPISLSFGYEISMNLLQLAQALSIIANDGYIIRPRIILNEEKPIKTGPIYSQPTINAIKEILLKTALRGTGKKASLKGYTIMGKTGTARLITNGTYDQTKHIFTFAGILEKGPFKRIIITFIKESELKNVDASLIAAPIFQQIAQKVIIHEKLIN